MKNNNKNVFITGVAGFIGFFLAKLLLKKGYKVFGVDSYDNYYSTNLKKERVKLLQSNKSFTFKKVDIVNFKKLKNTIKGIKFNFIFHFAAQAGVRYSLKNPKKYLDVNVKGFINVLEAVNKKNISKFFYASSSSVYGEANKFPVDEKQMLSPKNPYGLSKKINEEIASIYSTKSKINFIGLRLFTIYGEWGRPDMFIIKLLIKHLKNQIFELNNNGKHYRDFTYINDAIIIIMNLMKVKLLNKNEIFNICTSKPIYINKLKKYLEKKIKYKKIKPVNLNKADVIKTHGNNTKLIKTIGKFKFTNIIKGVDNTCSWFEKNKKLFL